MRLGMRSDSPRRALALLLPFWLGLIVYLLSFPSSRHLFGLAAAGWWAIWFVLVTPVCNGLSFLAMRATRAGCGMARVLFWLTFLLNLLVVLELVAALRSFSR